MSQWYIYLMRCADDSLYCGITTDVERRLTEHNGSAKGARYTRARRPVALEVFAECDDRSDAAKKEAAVKKLSRDKKTLYIQELKKTALKE
ncbi:MAG: GIY-YIG nuclease family protein [Desulfovibrio sp.]